MLDVIAVGTDGTPTADRAVEAAMDIAERFGAELVVLSAYDGKLSGMTQAAMAVAMVPSMPVEAEWTAQAAERVKEILARAEQVAAARGLRCRSAAAEGDPAELLVELAESHGADLLVIGNRGMQRRILGSVPNSVTHKVRCSVLVVKTT